MKLLGLEPASEPASESASESEPEPAQLLSQPRYALPAPSPPLLPLARPPDPRPSLPLQLALQHPHLPTLRSSLPYPRRLLLPESRLAYLSPPHLVQQSDYPPSLYPEFLLVFLLLLLPLYLRSSQYLLPSSFSPPLLRLSSSASLVLYGIGQATVRLAGNSPSRSSSPRGWLLALALIRLLRRD